MKKLIIYKYDLPLGEGKGKITLPVGAKILSGQVQHGKPVIWALIDPTQQVLEDRSFEWHGTGHMFEDTYPREHISSMQFEGGNFVFHLFEIFKQGRLT